jgi:hypothetical protein
MYEIKDEFDHFEEKLKKNFLVKTVRSGFGFGTIILDPDPT